MPPAVAPGAKLYVVVDGSLPPGLQAAQAIHAKDQFTREHREIEREWAEVSNTVALLAAPSERALLELTAQAARVGVRFAEFREPDLPGPPVTAVTFEPSDAARRLCRALPLALRK